MSAVRICDWLHTLFASVLAVVALHYSSGWLPTTTVLVAYGALMVIQASFVHWARQHEVEVQP